MNVTGYLGTVFPDILQAYLRSRQWTGRTTICLLNLNRQERQPLADVVMEISRDPAALLLLRFNQLATDPLKRLLGKLLVGGIDCRSDIAGKRSITVHPWRCSPVKARRRSFR